MTIQRLALWADTWLYPRFREQPVRRPLFLVGLPRSGTTFLHRVVAEDAQAFTTFRLWELLFAPAIWQKKLIRMLGRLDRRCGSPGRRLLRAVERAAFATLDGVHATTLESPEEDTIALLPFDGCFLRVVMDPRDPAVWQLGHFSDACPHPKRQRLLSVWREIVQRHLYVFGTGRTFVSKNPGFTSWIPDLRTEFADARFLGIHRDPREVVASQLSALRAGFRLFGHDVSDPDVARRFLQLLAAYENRLTEFRRTAPGDQFQLLVYRAFVADPEPQVAEALAALGYELSEAGQSAVAAYCAAARGYRSRHTYELSEFGLTAEDVNAAFRQANSRPPSAPQADETRSRAEAGEPGEDLRRRTRSHKPELPVH